MNLRIAHNQHLLVYVAGPIRARTARQRRRNIQRAIAAGFELIKRGHLPFIPHLSHWQNEQEQHPFVFWIGLDLLWIQRCDAVLRLPGQSQGADMEASYARAIGKPVFTNLSEVPWSHP